NEIQIEYHPRSCQPPNASHFEGHHSCKVPSCHTPYFDPWWPFFNMHKDFLLSEIILDFNLSHEQGERLIKFIKHCMSGKGTLMLSSMGDIWNAWDQVPLKLTPFENSVVSVPYKGEQRCFDMIYCSLWNWATDLIWDPQLASQFHWDAKKVFRCSGQSSTHIFDEPWTADAFWDTQVHIN
ncbi:hypothetical protein BJV74DRAFT_781981, partial [Russula compacta]